MKRLFIAIFAFSTLFVGCDKESDSPPTGGGTNPTTPTAALSFEDIVFNREYAYFSTDGSMDSPVDSMAAKTVTDKIDITYIFDADYSGPGFFDPISRSQDWYWDKFYLPWLDTGVYTRYYSSSLTKDQFNAAKADQSKIQTYFSDTENMIIAPHAIFPEGSCIGGRQSYDPQSVLLSKGKVFGFINLSTGKRGLMWINTSQVGNWPGNALGYDTKVSIIREQ